MAASRLSAAARRRRRSALLLAATVAAILGALALNAAGAVERLENQAIDTRFSVRGSQGAPKDVVVVGVDAKTFRARSQGGIGEQWPFARRRHAQIIDQLVRGALAPFAGAGTALTLVGLGLPCVAAVAGPARSAEEFRRGSHDARSCEPLQFC